MKRLLSIPRQQVAFFVCCGMMIALIYSKFALTVGMILLVLISLIDLNINGRLGLRLNPAISENFQKFLSRKDFLVVMLFFLIVLTSGLYSSDFNYLSERLRIKLPFLLLPFAFVSIPPFSKRQYHSLFYFMILVVTFSALLVGINYSLDYEAITESMRRGKAIPTPMNHIRYSLLVAFSSLSAAALWWKGFFLKYKGERFLILGIALFLFLFLHVLSVRSGLLVLYISIGFLSLRFIFLSKRYLLGFGMIIGVLLIPFLAYQTVPSLKNKVDYMRYDFDQYLEGNVKNHSDSERLISMEMGLKIGNEHPVLGVGAGDLKQAIRAIYKKEYPNINKPKMPHNQFLSVYAGMGILGLLTFLFAFFYPLWYQQNYQEILFSILHIIVFCSFFIENTIENAIGVAFYSLFLLLGLNASQPKSVQEATS